MAVVKTGQLNKSVCVYCMVFDELILLVHFCKMCVMYSVICCGSMNGAIEL